MKINIIGAGLAGCEAAMVLSKAGVKCDLYEMRPQKMTPAHKTDLLAELVCSNSFKSDSIENAKGLLKKEMREMGSFILKIAEMCSVPAGKSLNVDREEFSKNITSIIESDENINLRREEIIKFDLNEINVVSSGPLTSDALAEYMMKITGQKNLYFYDAVSPIIKGSTIDMKKTFSASRYGKGNGNILNFPLDKSEYEIFYVNLIDAETANLHNERNESKYFEACMPVETLAKRGKDAIRFGPMRPIGFDVQPKPYAIIQARPENNMHDAYELIGFQTRLKFSEQKRVFGLVPGLENAQYFRYGVMHRNTFIRSPEVINRTLQAKEHKNLFFAGQITGVEGYMESSATGIIAGLSVLQYLKGKKIEIPDENSMTGALLKYISSENTNFQPMNANFGLLSADENVNRSERRKFMVERSLRSIARFTETMSGI